MNPDLSALLAAFGPYGVAVALGLTLLVKILRARRPDLFPEPTEPSTPNPANPDDPRAPKYPLLDLLRKLIGRDGKPLESARDLSPVTLAAVRAEVDALATEQAAELRAKLRKVEVVAPPGPAAAVKIRE